MKRTVHLKKKKAAVRSSGAYEDALRAAGRQAILSALLVARGSRGAAIEALGIPPRTFYREIERLGLTDEIQRLAAAHGWQEHAGFEAGRDPRKPRS